ncbi:MAG: SH3 domain-containing protein [Cyclobacteriaceae bacterium]
MKDCQNVKREMKKLLFFLFLFVLAGIRPLAAQPAGTLSRADSLFAAQKFGQAFDLYSQVDNEGYESPAMLLRMAFIKEGLNEYDKALYYLNRYYLATYDRQALEKMAELAENEGLEGYALSDFRLFQTTFARYYDIIIALLAALALLVLALAIYRRQTTGRRPFGLMGAACALFILVLVLVNVDSPAGEYAILRGGAVYLMQGPSAGAELVAQTGPGHKVSIEEAGDIWTKVDWGEGEAWVRNSHLLTLRP